jgi:hypothetical protein
MFVLQSCTDSLHVLPGSSSETFPTFSNGTYGVRNVKMVDVKAEKEECIDVKDEEGIYSEDEEEDLDTKEDGDVSVKEDVSSEGRV